MTRPFDFTILILALYFLKKKQIKDDSSSKFIDISMNDDVPFLHALPQSPDMGLRKRNINSDILGGGL